MGTTVLCSYNVSDNWICRVMETKMDAVAGEPALPRHR